MDHSVQKDGSKRFGVNEAEGTLRLIATLPAPRGLEGRVHAHLRMAPRTARVFAWPVSLTRETGWIRSAAAAAIVCVVAGGGWGIYSRVGPAAQATAGRGGMNSFSTGAARRRPDTIEGPTVTQPAVEKTPLPAGAGKPLAKHPARTTRAELAKASGKSAESKQGDPVLAGSPVQ